VKPNDRYLIPGEGVELATRFHWAVLLGPASLLAAVTFIVFLISPVGEPTRVSNLLWLLILPVLGYFLWRLAEWAVDEVVVTNTRVFVVSGLFVRKVAMMPLARITDLTYERSVTGLLLGFGKLILESAGQDQALTNVDHLPKPDLYYETVTRLSLPTRAPQNPLPPKEYWDELLEATRDARRYPGNGSR